MPFSYLQEQCFIFIGYNCLFNRVSRKIKTKGMYVGGRILSSKKRKGERCMQIDIFKNILVPMAFYLENYPKVVSYSECLVNLIY